MSVQTRDPRWEALVTAGLFTEEELNHVVRVVIEIEPGRAVVHAQYLGDDRLADVIPALVGAEIRRSGKMTK